ncbi:hypothetical protein FAZ15_19230 [Sphingobacterium olei]|uniref:DNA alkylation repair protein n=1 Tax=Sphingobacterium olei TaxID=2571155 RepID=A0A4U0NF72_9SPHI|nr:EboA domain-containing protein [Sphingobacterium olei]TJZ52523.1 hypothetical protein FAZ15_19230 [Sphingobacterium olei]
MVDIEKKKNLDKLFQQIIQQNLSSDAWAWLADKVERIKTEEKTLQLNLSFAQLPRMSGKNNLIVQPEDLAEIATLLPGFSLQGWTADRLARVWLLMQLPDVDKMVYLKKIKNLFTVAEMNELVALYSALPFLHYTEEWISTCEEGIRSNIGTVLEAILYHNPYPAHALSEAAWNQMVLKAFFNEKDVSQIPGLKTRANQALAHTLNDYVQERLAAHRTVHQEIYRLIEIGK